MYSLPIASRPVHHSDDATQIATEMAEMLEALAAAHPEARDYYLWLADRAHEHAAHKRQHAAETAAIRAEIEATRAQLDESAERLVQEPDAQDRAMVDEIAQMKQRHEVAHEQERARRQVELDTLRREWRRVRQIGERALHLHRARPARAIEPHHHQHQRTGRARRRLVRASAAGGDGDGGDPPGPSDLLITSAVRE